MLTDLQQHFGQAVERLTPNFADSTDKLGLAVSGGPDSMALLVLAFRYAPARVKAATINHGLRPESADEAAMVADFCRELGVDHTILKPAKPITGNLQSSARTVRYGLLNDWASENNIGCIATAHHADDQLETVLQRLARGAGLDGLSGIRARNGNIIRPLLAWRKRELVDFCHDGSIPYVTDPSNSNRDFDRVRMRDALSHLDMLDPGKAVQSASALADAGTALDWAVARESRKNIRHKDGVVSLSKHDYPAEILRRLLLHCIGQLDTNLALRGDTQMRMLDELKAGRKTMAGDILAEGGEIWTFRKAPPRGEK